MAGKLKTPKAVVETVETLDAITPEVKGRGAIKLLLLAPVVAGVVGAVIHHKVAKPKEKPVRPGAPKVIVS